MIEEIDRNQSSNKQRLTFKQMISALIIMIFIIVVSLSTATQFLAHTFNYQAGLGKPAYNKVYLPWKVITWRKAYYKEFKKEFDASFSVGVCTFGGLIAIVFLLKLMWEKRPKAVHDLHG
ncbi:MAG: hypothetical protein HRT90_11970, partial [Candidatus Margulisbacteria bacterium]|nr:hypothetical protein [Candidatus Margulisiibacteriota bacterium]